MSVERDSQTIEELRSLQSLMAGAVMRTLTEEEKMQPSWIDGQPMADIADSFIKPNDRLTAFERLEIYNRQYWFRLVDCFFEDYRGLMGVLGEAQFNRLAIAYLNATPSTSFTLRNLGLGLVDFLGAHPELIEPRRQLSLDMARLEWAHIEAFDNEGLEPVKVDDILGADPAQLRLRLQPYVFLFSFSFPVDDLLLDITKSKQVEFRSEASNASGDRESHQPKNAHTLPDPEEIFLAVHRYDNRVFYKRMREDELAILCALRDGKTLEEALGEGAELATEPIGAWSAKLRESFEDWTSLGWLVLS